MSDIPNDYRQTNSVVGITDEDTPHNSIVFVIHYIKCDRTLIVFDTDPP